MYRIMPSVGLYSFLIVEGLIKYKLVNKNWLAYTYALFVISWPLLLLMSYSSGIVSD